MKLGYRKNEINITLLNNLYNAVCSCDVAASTIRMLWLFPCSSFSIRGKRFVDFCHWYCIPPINPDLDSVWRQSSTLFSILNTLMWRSVYFNRKFRKSKPSPWVNVTTNKNTGRNLLPNRHGVEKIRKYRRKAKTGPVNQ